MINPSDLDLKVEETLTGNRRKLDPIDPIDPIALKLAAMFQEAFSKHLEILTLQEKLNNLVVATQKTVPWMSVKPVEISPFKFLLCLHVPEISSVDSIKDSFVKVFRKFESAKLFTVHTSNLYQLPEKFPSIFEKSSETTGRVNAVGAVKDGEIDSFGCVEGFPFSKHDKPEHHRHFVIISVKYAYKKPIA